MLTTTQLKVDNVDMNELRNLGDKLKGEIGSGVVLVVSALAADKVNMIAMATDDVVAKGAHAGNLIKSVASLVGGGGGGRPNMAQAGGKNASGIDELLKKAPRSACRTALIIIVIITAMILVIILI